MTRNIDADADADAAPIQDPYALFAALLDLATDESVAVMARAAGQLHTGRLENIARDRLRRRQTARHEAAIKASSPVAA